MAEKKEKKKKKKEKKHRHTKHLTMAYAQTVFRLSEIVITVMLFIQYLLGTYYASAAALVCIFIFSGVTRVVWDRLNHGSAKYILPELLAIRVLFDLQKYRNEWKKNYGKYWADAYFQFHSSHERFLGPFASLYVQVYAMFLDPYNITVLQYLGFMISGLLATSEVFNLMRYVRPPRKVYMALMFKALFNTFLRTVCVGLTFAVLGLFSIILIFCSFGLGLLVYWATLKRSRKLTNPARDDPIKLPQIHGVFATQIASSLMFCAFPFAPSHCIEDWWFGYLISETKLNIENGIMAMFVAGTYSGSPRADPIVYASMAFACTVIILNFTLLFSLHVDMCKFLKARNIYSASPIVNFYLHLCKHTRLRLNQEKQDRQRRKEEGKAENYGTEMSSMYGDGQSPNYNPALNDLNLDMPMKTPRHTTDTEGGHHALTSSAADSTSSLDVKALQTVQRGLTKKKMAN